ncbi:RNA-binding (RRM/RBD/RNP motifs) family protein [Striga asiatica]|uniref:RNA-binding (RRM/RBD/RNP motifs) family protein n=1 Tax=Striga asiatica TaxID=4170 RepID=A0A5A7PG90_STRAF|nr:RNA-binding (RRM/RBD/RNP motifs) family protein [Striga asiatica]
MDFTKKRKADDNGLAYPLNTEHTNAMGTAPAAPTGALSPEDVEKILEPFKKEQILPILRAAILRHPDVLEAVRAVADADPVQRKLFVRGLGWETTTDKLRQVFSAYGELDEANTIVITDKSSGKSKGYGFVTFKHIDAAVLALKEPNKKIDGRITVTHLAAAGSSVNSHSADVALRKIYVGNIPFEISSERLLAHFSMYGEIEEGPLGFDKQTGKAKGFAFFVYKTEEGAKASLVDPMKTIDGHQVVCKLATDNKKQKPNTGSAGGVVPGPGMPASGPMPPRNYPMGGYPGYGLGPNMPQLSNQTGVMHQNASYNTPISGPGGPGGQGYVGGYGGVASGYDSVGVAGPGDYAGPMGNTGSYKMPPNSIGMQGSGVYPESGNYGPQAGYPPHPNHHAGPGPRFPAYQGMPPY